MNLYEETRKSFPKIEKLFTDDQLRAFKNTPSDNLYLYHFGLGAWIRNNLLLSETSKIYRLFICNNIKNKDLMSSKIIKLFHEYQLRIK